MDGAEKPITTAQRKPPSLQCLDGLVVHTERFVERTHHTDFTDRSVRLNDCLHYHGALDVGSVGAGREMRFDLVDHALRAAGRDHIDRLATRLLVSRSRRRSTQGLEQFDHVS